MTKRKFSEEQEKIIIERYIEVDGNCNKVAREYNVFDNVIQGVLSRNNAIIKHKNGELQRKYFLNEDYFDVINTERKAYLLGFLYADGYNYSDKARVVIALQQRDVEILDLFKKELGYNRPYEEYKRSLKNSNWQDIYRFTISSRYLCDRLSELGCVQAKSLILQFPSEEQVPSNLVRHFIRGYFDGDGCFSIYLKKGGYYGHKICITSTNNFCIKLQEIILKELCFKAGVSIKKPRSNNQITSDLAFGGRLQTIKFGDWIYKDAMIYLQRKHDKYLEALAHMPKKVGRKKNVS